jgi:hypothetical protein
MRRNLMACFMLVFIIGLSHIKAAEVKTIRVPHRGEVPEVVLDAQGVLHMTYGRGLPGNAYYVRSSDCGKTFSEPVQLNRQEEVVTVTTERGPKLAIGKDGSVHVVWLGYYKAGGGIFYTRSTDGGKTFSAEQNVLDMKTGCDNATVAADEDGNIFVLWTDGRLGEDSKSPIASPIFMAKSSDNGATFSKNFPIKHDYPGRACGCCRLEAHVAGENLHIAFRGGYLNIRDPHLLKGRKNENDFKSDLVSEDKWNSTAAP